jgi:hypothetical protein
VLLLLANVPTVALHKMTKGQSDEVIATDLNALFNI